jgi:hypothetical protein
MRSNVRSLTMKTARTVIAFLLVLGGALAIQPAFAAGPHGGGGHGGGGHGGGGHGGGHWHGSVGLYFGAPLFGYGYGYGYGYPYYYPPYYPPYYSSYYPPVQQAPVYVEQDPQGAPSAQQSAPAGYWYYCADSRAYYPYVKECPAGWQRVAPQPN